MKREYILEKEWKYTDIYINAWSMFCKVFTVHGRKGLNSFLWLRSPLVGFESKIDCLID